MNNKQSKIRNFSIIAHIDHGKSTLADRILEYTGTISKREMMDQILDTMAIERERGITIKLQAVRIDYKAKDGNDYIINLIDTPGHVDFTYEVSRSLAACEGCLLVVDSTQGVEAQTIANSYLAIDNNLEIIPVINKIDLQNSDIEKTKNEINDIIGIDASSSILVSAKEGSGVAELMEAIVNKIPQPKGESDKPLKALIFDSIYDSYRGVVIFIRIFDGQVSKGDKIKLMYTDKVYEVTELGIFKIKQIPVQTLSAGETGSICASIKNIRDARVGDTVTLNDNPTLTPLPGYRPAIPMVFCGMFPMEADQYNELREALLKLQLNDAALYFEPETSVALGFGFRCGFLGLLHMEIVQERLEREYNMTLIKTAPSVVYKVILTDNAVIKVDNPVKLPDPTKILTVEEPYVKVTMVLPDSFIGAVMELSQNKRGVFQNMNYINQNRVILTYEMPLSELITDFFDQLKSRTRGYASLDYEYIGTKPADLVKLDILIAGDVVDALSSIITKENSYRIGKGLVQKLRKLIPRQMFEVAIQAAIGNKIIARETIAAMKKNVLAKCYGGDISRKRKLLEKQKEGKKRMKQVGRVEIPQEAFMSILDIEDEK